MSTFEGNIKTGHPVAGIVLAVLGIVIAVLLSLLFGVIAGAVAAVLGLTAVLLGVKARRGGRGGIGAVVTGVLAVVLALVLSVTSVVSMEVMHKAALESGKAPVFAECFDNPYMGLSGVFLRAASDPDKVNVITKELDALKDYTEKDNTAHITTEAEPQTAI